MGRIQTRRSVSLNGKLHARLAAKCAAYGLAQASVIELLVEQWLDTVQDLTPLQPLPEEEVARVAVKASPAPKEEHVVQRATSLRLTMDKRRADAAERARAEAIRLAAEDPCRRDGCAIIELHPHSDPRHFKSKRGIPKVRKAEVES